MGDVWPHPAIGSVPFHKLSQWLSYSLVEPLEGAGLKVVELDELTGLPEYRNGGLLVDAGALRPKQKVLLRRPSPGDEPIVEWRALTVALLDRSARMCAAIWAWMRAPAAGESAGSRHLVRRPRACRRTPAGRRTADRRRERRHRVLSRRAPVIPSAARDL